MLKDVDGRYDPLVLWCVLCVCERGRGPWLCAINVLKAAVLLNNISNCIVAVGSGACLKVNAQFQERLMCNFS